MRATDISFSLRFLGSGAADVSDLDRALAIYVENTSPFLRTKTNQIRAKIASPVTSEGHFYFIAFYRSNVVIGFAMFGYYPRSNLLAVDHLVIDQDQRGAAAFYVFAQLLHDAIRQLEVEIDFAVVELEKSTEFGSDQTGGSELARLLGQVGFGRVHIEYVLANMEPRNYQARYEGILMLRGSQRLYKFRREELLDIYHSILFEHYLPWFGSFLGEQIASYKNYLESLYSEFEERVQDQPIIQVNGPESDILVANPAPQPNRPPEIVAAWYVAMFAATAAIVTGVLYLLKTPPSLTIPFALALLTIFVGVAAASRGQAFEVFERAVLSVSGGTRKLRYLQSNHKPKSKRKADLPARGARRNLPDPSFDKKD